MHVCVCVRACVRVCVCVRECVEGNSMSGRVRVTVQEEMIGREF